MKTRYLAIVLALSLLPAWAQPITVDFLGGYGVPISDRDLLTAGHLATNCQLEYDRHPTADLAIVHFAPGTFSEWASISVERHELGDPLLVAHRTSHGLEFECQTVTGFLGVNLVRTEPLLRLGDSGGGVFDSDGRLTAINTAIDSRRNSYHTLTAPSAEWINLHVTAVPEPGTITLLVIGAAALGWRMRR